ncbi:hypothetical protein [Streptomyces sp. NRRL WC-3626]|uniref:hypothetical protein n=1 Tax=Streptomyces sp. NRRL WC-3626 TaxID=1463926 RepID=UPI0004C05DCE|nr:hypothetical protein [Streptomyces sp. NRRL WC-3626]
MTDVTRRPGDVPPPREGYDIPAPAPETDIGPGGRTAADGTGTNTGTGTGTNTGVGTNTGTGTGADTGVGTNTGNGTGADTGAEVGTRHTGDRTPDVPLLPHDDTDTFEARLRHAVAGFVDAPNDSVQEADHVLEELAARFTDAVTERRRTLRGSWRTDGAEAADTERLRLALRDYRELAERLLHV